MLARCPYEFRPLVAGRRARGSYAPRRAGPTWLHRMSAEIAAFAASVQKPTRIEGICRILRVRIGASARLDRSGWPGALWRFGVGRGGGPETGHPGAPA